MDSFHPCQNSLQLTPKNALSNVQVSVSGVLELTLQWTAPSHADCTSGAYAGYQVHFSWGSARWFVLFREPKSLRLIFLQVEMELTYTTGQISPTYTHTLTSIPATQSQLVLGASTPFPDFIHPGVLRTAGGIESAVCADIKGEGE